jgi:Ca-activated chloride channel family protein
MRLLWTGLLYLLFLIPASIGVYLWSLRQRRFAIRYSSLSLLHKYIPFLLFLLALAGLVVALGRPVATVIVPSNRATVSLAVEVSRSMCSTDIPSNRLIIPIFSKYLR